MSLFNMATSIKVRVSHIEENLYHQGLIKIIVTEVLKKQNKTWEGFLV